MQQSYFTSDWHWNHERSLRFPARSHLTTHKELEDRLLAITLDTLHPGDNLYYLGDLEWKATPDSLSAFFDPFKKHRVNFFWIKGNHDSIPSSWEGSKALVWVDNLRTIKVQGQKIVLCHYPMLCWDSSHHGSQQLHGHIHKGDLTHQKGFDQRSLAIGKQLNVNVEFHNWRPWSFDEVADVMSARTQNWDYIEKGKDNTDGDCLLSK